MASPESKYLTDLYSTWSRRMAAQPDMDLDSLRALFEEFQLPTREPAGVSYIEVDAGGVPALWASPEGAAEDRVILYSHGGGFVLGSMHSHRKLAGHLARSTGCRALVLDYRRAPEHPYPAGLDDTVAAYAWLLDRGVAAQHVATSGDSAGGNLAIAAVLRARDAGMSIPAAIVAISPFLDMNATGETLETRRDRDQLLQRPILDLMIGMYLNDGSRDEPYANPLKADLSGLPPVLVEVGDDETLLADSQRFVVLARAAGVDAELAVVDGMQHVFPCLAGRAPEADESIERIGRWLRPRLELA